MKFFFFIAKHNKFILSLAILVGMISGVVNAKLISLISESLALTAESAERGSAGFFFIVVAVAVATSVMSQLLLIFLSQNLAFNLRINMCLQMMKQPLQRLEEVGQARLTATYTRDIPSITTALLQIPAFTINTAISLGCLVYLGYLSLSVLLTLMGFLAFSVAAYLLPEKVAFAYVKRTRQAWDVMLEHFSAMNEGAKELKLNAKRRRAFFDKVLYKATKAFRDTGMTHSVIYSLLHNLSQIAFFAFVGYLLFILPAHKEIALTTLMGFAFVALYIRGPIVAVVNAVPMFRDATAAFDAMKDLGLSLDGRDYDPKESQRDYFPQLPPNSLLEELQVQELSYSFYREDDDRHFTLGPLSFNVKAGEMVFIIGGNGSGKTTLAKLLTGLYPPDSGRLMVNGSEVTEENREQYQQYVSAIFSDFYVFQQLLGQDEADLEEKAAWYIAKLCLTRKVSMLDGQLTNIKLSSGQRKRLALLAAYLEDREIYLFDEWAADQDPEFKEVFYHQLLPELKQRGKTVFVISHDDRYFDQADHLIRLTDGKLEKESLRSPAVLTTEP
ncbi:MAG: cyclic peptide export ABC transporter [Acidobacteriota bacterium]|nr:cyclic peptide export ABC transporter [Acidobacteriota bacterium]